jgi:cbb3-type cytochrome oxidase subunit 3
MNLSGVSLNNLLSNLVRSTYEDYKEELKIVCFKFIIFFAVLVMLAVSILFLRILPISGYKKIILENIEFWGTILLLILFFFTAYGDIMHAYRRRHKKAEVYNE